MCVIFNVSLGNCVTRMYALFSQYPLDPNLLSQFPFPGSTSQNPLFGLTLSTNQTYKRQGL